jgi:hypothetical protein
MGLLGRLERRVVGGLEGGLVGISESAEGRVEGVTAES